MHNDEWFWSEDHHEACKIIETQELWGDRYCRVWLPGKETVARVRADRLRPLGEAATLTVDGIMYIAAAARVAEALAQDVLLAPIESSVIPLPHQIRALSRAVSNDRVRYLLADEVGLGKTIEAGLIMRELKLRGLVRRTLVVAPKGLVTQWVSEMKTHFNEEFRLVIPSDITAYRRLVGEENVWRRHDQVVCPVDSVKPLEGRQGWSQEEVAEYNRERFDDLIAAGWDLIVVDEAHRLGGSTEQVARHKLGLGLAEAAPYLLLLSATPHQGKTDAFHRVISLVDSVAFPDASSVTRDRVQPYVIRTEKRQAIDAEGKPLFKPRITRLVPVDWLDRHAGQRELYEAVSEYVRVGYNQALKEKKAYLGFLLLLIQRLVTSSTRAIRTTLEKRLAALQAPDEQLSLALSFTDEEWADLDGQDQVDALLKTRLMALKNERAEVDLLLDAARRTEAKGPDAKAEALLDLIYKIQQEETAPEIKILIFTEFVPTQDMLREFLTERGFSVVCLNGSMDMEERKKAQDHFAREARIMVSTEAGGEGLNLQFCHIVVNYDIPWNPMRLEQRIGRVDRIGQLHTVRAFNLILGDTVEYRVREVLEQKLAVILEEFGVDKTGDVLDSAEASHIFDELYIAAISDPGSIESKVSAAIGQVQERASAVRRAAAIFGESAALDPGEAGRVMDHPILHWVERMTVSYLKSSGGAAEKLNGAWRLKWPDGEEISEAVFTVRDAEKAPSAEQLTLEDARIRSLAAKLPQYVEGQAIPSVTVSGLSAQIKGCWSLWRISIRSFDWNRQRCLPLFVDDAGKVFLPTARHIWEQLIAGAVKLLPDKRSTEPHRATQALRAAAEAHGRPIFDELAQMHRKRLKAEREKGEYSFSVRKKAIERIGLPAVRVHRLNELGKEQCKWQEEVRQRTAITPEIMPWLILRIEGGGGDG